MARQNASLRSVYALRGFLVLALIAFQSVEVSETYGRIADTALWVVPGWSVGALFALAGFTATRGIDRRGGKTTAMRSAMRYLPVLVLLVSTTAYGLGAILTSESRRSYFVDPDVAAYLLNGAGILRSTLPGVFEFNAAAGVVNAILWIVPVGYCAALVLAATTWRPRWRTHMLVAIGLLLVVASSGLFFADADLGDGDDLLVLLLAGKGLCALLCFVVGALTYQLRAHVPIDWRVALAVLLLTVLIALVSDRSWSDAALFNAGMAAPIAYFAIYGCSLPWPLRHWTRQAEPLMVRMLLVAYPVQQSWIALGPDRQSGLLNLALSFPVIVALAAGEWWLIERPLLRRFVPGALPPAIDASSRRRPGAKGLVEHARATLPLLFGALVVIVLVLAALALTMFAMQRDAGGA